MTANDSFKKWASGNSKFKNPRLPSLESYFISLPLSADPVQPIAERNSNTVHFYVSKNSEVDGNLDWMLLERSEGGRTGGMRIGFASFTSTCSTAFWHGSLPPCHNIISLAASAIMVIA